MIYRPGPFALNGICAYFTMFPLRFPRDVLVGRAEPGDIVLDPFCGRGTTNYAARLAGLATFGIDSNPVAVALTEAKLANVEPSAIISEAKTILSRRPRQVAMPAGEFWSLAFDPTVLHLICQLRRALLQDAVSSARKALRAIVLGALHGPQPKHGPPSYLSNHCQRTYSPKPRYAVRYWAERDMRPPSVDVLDLIKIRAERYFGRETTRGRGAVCLGDSRNPAAIRSLMGDYQARWVITSPPYYGLDTYFPDQWLRHWFLGGPEQVRYVSPGQIDHRSPQRYVAQLRRIWRNAAAVSRPDAQLIIRFGGIQDRKANPLSLVTASMADSGWRLDMIRSAGTANRGKRQAKQFAHMRKNALQEFDLWASRAD